MPFQKDTLEQIRENIISDLESSFDGVTILRRAILRILGKIQAGAIYLLYGNIEYNKDQQFVSSADEEYLPIHGSEYGVSRNAAVKATGYILVTGTNGTNIPSGTELESSTGEIYYTDTLGTISGSSTSIAITAKTAGAAGNEVTGASLSFVSPIVGIDSTATVITPGIEGGTDLEDIEDYRTRVLARKSRPPHGGADFDYETWMKEVSGVTRAWSIPLYQGIGTIGCAFTRDNDDDIIPSTAEIATVRAYIIEHTDSVTGKQIGIPATAEAGLYMIQLTPKSVNLIIQLYPNTAAIRALVTTAMEELIYVKGGPNEAIYTSDFGESVSSISSVKRHLTNLSDYGNYISASATEIHVLGDITFQDY